MASRIAKLIIEVTTKEAQAEVKRLREELDRIVKESRNVKVSQDTVQREMRETGTEARKTGMNVRGFRTEMQSTTKTAGLLRSQLGPLIGGLTAFAGIRRTVSTITSFEQALAALRGVTGAAGADLALLAKTAREAGATTRYTATQAAEGLLELSRAGLSVQQSTVALGPSLNLATAGMMSLAESADLVTNVAAQFGLPATQIKRIGDVLVATANRSNTNVAQLGQALKDVGVVAAGVGLTLEETSAALGVLANRGLKGSDGAIKLRQSFLQLLSPSAEAVSTLRQMGLTIADVDTRTLGFEQVLRNLKRAQLDIVQASQLVDSRNAAALVTVSQNVDEYTKLLKVNKAVNDEMGKFAQSMDDTIIGSWKSLNSAIDEMLLKSGDAGVTGFLRGIIDRSTEVVRSLGGIKDGITEIREEAAKGIVLNMAVTGQSGFASLFSSPMDPNTPFQRYLRGEIVLPEGNSSRGERMDSSYGSRAGDRNNPFNSPFREIGAGAFSSSMFGFESPADAFRTRRDGLSGFFGMGGVQESWLDSPEGSEMIKQTGQFRDELKASNDALNSWRMDLAESVAGGVGDFLRSLKDNGDIGQALSDGLTSISDRMFENSVQSIENSLSAALGGALDVPVSASPGEQAIVTTLQQTNAILSSIDGKAGIAASGGGAGGTPGAAAGGAWSGLGSSLALGGIGLGLGLLGSRMSRSGGGGADDRGVGYEVRGGGVTINDYSRTSIQSSGNPRQTIRTARMAQEDRWNRFRGGR